MIRGTVNARREAVVALILFGPGGKSVDIEAIIDTGFNGMLVVADAIAIDLGLIRSSSTSAVLADGSSKLTDVFAADLEWDGSLREVLVSALGEEPLLGMALLENCHLEVEAWPGGAVVTSARP